MKYLTKTLLEEKEIENLIKHILTMGKKKLTDYLNSTLRWSRNRNVKMLCVVHCNIIQDKHKDKRGLKTYRLSRITEF